MSNTIEVPWSTVARNAATKRCFVPPIRGKVQNVDSPLVPEILFEDENLKNELLVRKATAIIQQALTPGSVLFQFPSKLFGDRVDAYQVIEKQISANVDFLPLSCLASSTSGELLIEAKFVSADHAKLALETGVTVGDVVYKAVSSKCGSSVGQGLTHVQFTLLSNVSRDPKFLVYMLDSLQFYGKVYQLKKFSRKGYFEGKMSVLLDTSVGYENGEGEVVDAEPLSRQLYLSAWDTYAPASFKNVPPICHFCRLSGHLRVDCPQLAKRRCFGCHQLGHTARFCKSTKGKQQDDLSEGDALDQYAKDSRKAAKSAVATVVKDLTVPNKDLTDLPMSMATEVPAKDLSMVHGAIVGSEESNDEDMEMDEPAVVKKPFVSGVDGSRASKYADYLDGTGMKVDSAAEMMSLTKVSPPVKAKMSHIKKVTPPSSSIGRPPTLGKAKGSISSSSVGRKAQC
jgi:hypothetical protein